MYSIAALDLPPLRAAAGSVSLPGSKSISNRALLLAALARGRTQLDGLLASDDTQVMIQALQALGVQAMQHDDVCTIDSPGAGSWAAQAQLFLGNAGTAMRPLVAVLACAAAIKPNCDYQLHGTTRMHERPIGDLVDALVRAGCTIDYAGQQGFPPLRIYSPASDTARACVWSVRGDVSSQFLTALLLAAPLVSAAQDVSIIVQGELISRPYIDITIKLMAAFGVAVHVDASDPVGLRYHLAQGSQYRSPGHYAIEPDASSASYFLAVGAIASDTGMVIEGLGHDSIQGDIAFVDAVRTMGAEVNSEPHRITVRRGAWPLKAIDLDCNAIPDAAMTLAVMALYARGPCILRNIASWRVKETDRLYAMRTELAKCGAQVEEGPDYLIVHPLAPAQWRSATIRTYDDHRIAMCFGLCAFNPAQRAMRILDPACVAKTFPSYFETLFAVAKCDLAHIPVIAIDGPSASGKGTLAAQLAAALGYHYLDSGALYRAVAFAALQSGVDVQDEAALVALLQTLEPVCSAQGVRVRLQQQRHYLSDALRSETVGNAASKLAALPAVRAALLQVQRASRQLPGLVCDGRDMGTVVFADAQLKVYLSASAQARAQRRVLQLTACGEPADYATILADLHMRDARDHHRSVAPLRAATDAVALDNSQLDKEQSLAWVLARWAELRDADTSGGDHTPDASQ